MSLKRSTLIYIAIGLAVFAYGIWYRSDSVYQHFASGVPDDAAYYLKPALNFATGNGSSFDGIYPTNGYQPLWFLTLAGFLRVLPLDQMSLQDIWYAALILQALIAGIFTGVFAKFLGKLSGNVLIGTILGVLPMLVIPGRILNLLETPLQLLIFAFLGLQLLTLLERPAYEDFREKLVILGLTCGALFLARTDGIFMIGALCLPLAIKFRQNRTRLIWFIIPALSVVVIYMLSNYMNFGILMPVSGAVKLDSMYQTLRTHPGWDFLLEKCIFIFGPWGIGNWITKILLEIGAFIPSVLLIIKQVRGKILSNQELVLMGLSSFLLLKYLGYTTLYHGWRTNSYWYWVIDVVIWIVILAVPIRRILEKYYGQSYVPLGKKLEVLIPTVLLLISVFIHAQATSHTTPRRDTSVLLGLADFLRTHKEYFDTKRLGAYNSGILGYFSDLRITNLDGLINSVEYAKLIRQGRRDEFIGNNIDILIEYHDAYIRYYAGLGFSLYNVRQYIAQPVPFDPVRGDDYRIYVRNDQKEEFESFLTSIKQ